ncbi:MAG: hypothetical protein ACLU9T_18035 [Blautia faecis]
MDLVHAASTVIFLWLLSRPLLEKLERIKVKIWADTGIRETMIEENRCEWNLIF